MAGYYIRFVEGFSKLALPLTTLTKKKATRFKWTHECERSFQELKHKLTTIPILTLPTPGKEFEIFYDASYQGLGCVIMQKLKVIAYMSKQLKLNECNYPMHNLELEDTIYALKILRHYLFRENCNNFTNHKSLKYIFDKKELNLRQRRWMKLIKDY